MVTNARTGSTIPSANNKLSLSFPPFPTFFDGFSSYSIYQFSLIFSFLFFSRKNISRGWRRSKCDVILTVIEATAFTTFWNLVLKLMKIFCFWSPHNKKCMLKSVENFARWIGKRMTSLKAVDGEVCWTLRLWYTFTYIRWYFADEAGSFSGTIDKSREVFTTLCT